ncbi:hypothetical protein STEG23_034871 [Scotinomys teguina]
MERNKEDFDQQEHVDKMEDEEEPDGKDLAGKYWNNLEVGPTILAKAYDAFCDTKLSQYLHFCHITASSIAGYSSFLGPSLKKLTQELPVTLRRRGPRSSQSPSEEEDPGAASHPQRKRTQEQPVTLGGRAPLPRPRSSQPPSEEEDPGATSHPQRKRTPGAASHPQRKRTQEQPVTLEGRGSRSTQTPLEQETSPAPHPRQKWKDITAKVHTTT